MDSTHDSAFFPKTIEELLPSLKGITTNKKNPPKKPGTSKQTKTPRCTSNFKPLTFAEMKAELQVLKPQSPVRNHFQTSAMKKKWNSSVKVENKKTPYQNKLHNTTVRKTLNFQCAKPRSQVPKVLITKPSIETPKFVKPECKPIKYLQATNNIRISGICEITQTPVPNSTRLINKKTKIIHNKENIRQSYKPITPKCHKKTMAPIPDTPISTCSDSSFLQFEKQIAREENFMNALVEEPTLEDIAKISPPISTPFNNYRSVHEYFNESCDTSVAEDTIMCFDKTLDYKLIADEPDIASLCDLMKNANFKDVTTLENTSLPQMKMKIEGNLAMLSSSIAQMRQLYDNNVALLRQITYIMEHKSEKTLVVNNVYSHVNVTNIITPEKPKKCIESPSVVETLKKKSSLCKKIIYKSLPSKLDSKPEVQIQSEDRAMSMYMEMKEQMNFLKTPQRKKLDFVSNSPDIMSHNLQRQLDRLYND